MLVCLSIYCIFYFFQNAENLFSKDMLSKAKQVMEYDVNFNEIYKYCVNWLNTNNIFSKESENKIENIIANELTNEVNLNETVENNTNIGGGTEEKIETNLSQMEIDANEIKNKYNIFFPYLEYYVNFQEYSMDDLAVIHFIYPWKPWMLDKENRVNEYVEYIDGFTKECYEEEKAPEYIDCLYGDRRHAKKIVEEYCKLIEE